MSLADEIRQEILRYAAANPQDAYSRLGLTDMRKRGKNLVARCPFSAHADRNPSLNIGTEDDKAGLFYCFGCGIGGSIVEFYCQLRGYTRSSKEVLQELATVLGLATAPVKTKARTRPPKQDKPQDTQEDLNALAGELHDHLTPDALRFLQEQRGLSKKIIRAALLGCNGEGEYTIPVFDEAFQSVLDIRGYRPGGETKMRSLRPGHGGTRFYFPPGWHRPRAGDTLYITEGEMDCLLLADMGLLALTNTNGASSWPKEEETNTWDLSGVRVVLASDNDEAGQKRNDRLAAWAYERGADSVYVLQWPEDTPDNGFDVTDYAREYGKDALRQLLQDNLQLVPKPQIKITLRQPTDLGNAELFAQLFAGQVAYCWIGSSGKWLVWNGKKWECQMAEVKSCAKECVRAIYRLAADEISEDRRRELARHALRSENAQRIEALLELARSETAIATRPEDYDADPWLLNTQNGIVDLRTGELLPHDSAARLTKITAAGYDPHASCPTWQNFLQEIFLGNEDLIRFVQKSVGLALIGKVLEHCLFVLYGTGANGKSTFLNALIRTLGDYAQEAAPELLLLKLKPEHPAEVADLCGLRLVATIEVEQGRRLAEAKVKQLTGGDPIKARFMHKDYFQFIPSHTIFMATNHKPIVYGTDEAIWRRIKLIPFLYTVPEDKRDPELLDKLLQEKDGILAWAVQGTLIYRQEGLNVPPEVSQATREYRAEMDVLADFLEECCEIAPQYEVPLRQVYEAYKQWAEENGEKVLSQRVFSQRLTERGIANRRRGTGGKVLIEGLRLR